MKKTLLLAAVAALFTFNAFAQKTSVTTSTADTWIRSDNATKKNGNLNTIEFKNNATGSSYFYGLLSFSFTKPDEGNTVKKASLRLTTRKKAGDSETAIYDLNKSFTEDDTYKTIGEAASEAANGAPVVTFKLNSEGSKAPTDNNVTKTDVADWQTTVDITELVKAHANEGTINIILAKVKDQNNSSQVYSKEATDVTNSSKNFTFAAADLVPQLTVEYAKAETTAINNIDAQKPAANDDIVYNLAGQRVGKDYKGIVIKNGKKILVK